MSYNLQEMEFTNWNIKKAPLLTPSSAKNRERRVTALLSGDHPYLISYTTGLINEAKRQGISLNILNSEWDPALQEEQVESVITDHPDLVILIPENSSDSSYLYKKLYENSIPVIAANMVPDKDGLKYVLCYTGPDDWSQSRSLANKFASLMNESGGYCILCHIDNTSTYYARKYGVLSEIEEKYPKMCCLAAESGGLSRKRTKEVVKKWLLEFGKNIKGIVSADDNVSQLGILDALMEFSRDDIICVANGSTAVGIDLINSGKIDAITWQEPEMDGTLPIQVAGEWFNGLEISPYRFLPVTILDKDNIKNYLQNSEPFVLWSSNNLSRAILELDKEGIHNYFTQLVKITNSNPRISKEYIQGFSIEILAIIIGIIKSENLNEQDYIISYESMFKNLTKQRSVPSVFNWLEELSLKLCTNLLSRREVPKGIGEMIMEFINRNYSEPMSLKTLSQHFNLSAQYLGQIFIEENGESFSSYLNKFRINKSCELLKKSRITASQAGIDVGFTTSNYFFRTFQKYVGCSPNEYINREKRD